MLHLIISLEFSPFFSPWLSPVLITKLSWVVAITAEFEGM